jgi:hypothetical protein
MVMVSGIVGAIVIIGIIGALLGIWISRRRRAANCLAPSSAYGRGLKGGGAAAGADAEAMAIDARGLRNSDSSVFVPLPQDNYSSDRTRRHAMIEMTGRRCRGGRVGWG